jgi:hypothetical protein
LEEASRALFKENPGLGGGKEFVWEGPWNGAPMALDPARAGRPRGEAGCASWRLFRGRPRRSGFRHPLSSEYEISLDAAWGAQGDGDHASGWSLNLLRIF